MEAMISSGLFLLILNSAVAVIVLGQRFLHLASASSEVQQNALVAIREIERAVEAGKRGSAVADPAGFSFVSAENDGLPFLHDDLGNPLWTREVCFYQDVDGQARPVLVRKDARIDPPSADAARVAGTPLDVIGGGGATSEVAREITDLRVELTPLGGAEISVTASQGTGRAKNELTIMTRVKFRQ